MDKGKALFFSLVVQILDKMTPSKGRFSVCLVQFLYKPCPVFGQPKCSSPFYDDRFLRGICLFYDAGACYGIPFFFDAGISSSIIALIRIKAVALLGGGFCF